MCIIVVREIAVFKVNKSKVKITKDKKIGCVTNINRTRSYGSKTVKEILASEGQRSSNNVVLILVKNYAEMNSRCTSIELHKERLLLLWYTQ